MLRAGWDRLSLLSSQTARKVCLPHRVRLGSSQLVGQTFGGPSVRSTRLVGTVTTSLFNSLPQHSNLDSLWPEIRHAVSQDSRTLVVLDDDPTGCQTAYDVNVILDSSMQTLIDQFKRNEKLFYIINNTPAMPAEEAKEFKKGLVHRLDLAARMTTYCDMQLISRGDSTLRGHFPIEVDCILSTYPLPFDGVILAPAFFDGGRVTVNDVHYLQEGETLTPVSETPFAKDAHFGYKHSDLKAWIMEKCNTQRGDINLVSISLEDIRQGGPLQVANKLENMPMNTIVIVNGALIFKLLRLLFPNLSMLCSC
jgi:hypothetical protein